MLKLLKKDGFASIVEVIVASVIFVVTALGVFSSIAMLRAQGGGSTERLEAIYVGKLVMDDLRAQVYGNTWNTGPLAPGAYTQTIGAYTVSYTMSDVPGLALRKMTMTVTYPDN